MRRTVIPIAAAACVSFALAAHADTKIVERTVVDCPGLKSMLAEIPETQRAGLMKMVDPMLTGVPWTTTTYLAHGELRTDMGGVTEIVDAVHQRSTTINHQTHTFSLEPYDPLEKTGGQMTAHVAAAGGTGSILGHPVRAYVLTMTSSLMPKSRISGEIWSAPDLPQPLAGGYPGGSAGILDTEMKNVRGMPLKYHLVYKDTPLGDITVDSIATSISTTPLPKTAFAVPSGYSRGGTTTAQAMPSVGFPLGDGMPLNLGAGSGDAVAGGLSGGLGQMLGGNGGLSGLSQMLGGSGGLSGLSQMLGGSGGLSGLSQMLGNGGGDGLSGILQMLGSGGSGLPGLSQMLGGSGSGDGLSGLLQMLGGSGGGDLSGLSKMLGGLQTPDAGKAKNGADPTGGGMPDLGGLLQSLQGMLGGDSGE